MELLSDMSSVTFIPLLDLLHPSRSPSVQYFAYRITVSMIELPVSLALFVLTEMK